MIVTKFICDRCKHEQANGDQMWNVAIALRYHGSYGPISSHNEQLWCRGCCDAVGLFPKYAPKPSPAPEPPPPSFEDMLREIIREEIQNAD